MNEFWASMDTFGKVLFCTALASSTVLVIQIVFMIIGFATGGLGDAVGIDGGDIDGDGISDVNDGSGEIGLLTIKGIVSFFAVGSWTALGLELGNAHTAVSVTVGLIAGIATLIGVGFLYRALYKLQSNGNIQIKNAIGLTAEVYIPISANGGAGKVNVIVQGRLVEAEAKTLGEKELKTGSLVKIIDVVNGVLIVEAKESEENVAKTEDK